MLKLDTLKNKIETIIPFNVRSIYDGKYEGLVKVGDEQGIRLFKLSDKTFLTPVFTGLGHGLNGYIAAQVNHKWGVIDSLGNWLYPPRLDYRPAFRKDLISIINNEKKVGLQENGQFKFTNSDFEIMGKYGYQSNLSIFHLNGKYGIINTATKDTVLAPDYDDFYFDTHAHSGGLEFSVANKIIKNKKVGLINLAGKLIAPCIYTKINELSRYRKDERHFFRVKINNKQGIIDHEGNEILAPKYDEIKHINNETYAFKKGKKWGYVYLRQESPLNEKKVVSPKYTSIRVDNGKILYTTKREEKEKVLNLIPKPIIRNLKFTHQTSLGETFILFQNAGEPLGIYNSQTKKIIIPPTYDSYTKLNNSHLVSLKKGQKYSVFNYRTGNTYHKNKFDYIASPYATTGANLTHKFHSSYSTCKAVKIDDKWGLMNAKGEIILEAKAKKMPRLNEENLFEIQINNHNHLVDTTGKIVLTTEIKKAPTGYGSCIPFQEDNLWGLKNADGEIIFDAEFRYWPKLNKQNLFEIYIDGRFHHVDTIGKIVLATDFTDISPTENSGKKMVMFKTDSNLWGVADSNFQVIFHPQFELYKFKHNWFLQVQKQEKWYWLKPDFTLGDTDSIPKFKPNGYPNFGYDLAYPYKYNLSSPYFIVIKNDKKGLIDTLGKEIIAPEYERIFVLSDTLAVVKKEKKYGVLNLQTKTLQQPIILACLEIWLTLS